MGIYLIFYNWYEFIFTANIAVGVWLEKCKKKKNIWEQTCCKYTQIVIWNICLHIPYHLLLAIKFLVFFSFVVER